MDNAIMYMQNVLSCIQHKIDNEVNYTAHFKQVAASQMAKILESEEQKPDEVSEAQIRAQLEGKYQNLIKNAHQYLAYMYLLTYSYSKCISHGKKLLAIDGIAQ
jgi:hypothetical protein